MEEIFKQYSTPIIIVLVVIALIAIFAVLLSKADGAVMSQFKDLLTSFFEKANGALSGWTPPTPN